MGKINLSSTNTTGNYAYEIEATPKNIVISEKGSSSKDLTTDTFKRRLYINRNNISSINITYGDHVTHEKTSLKAYLIAGVVILAVAVALAFVNLYAGIAVGVIGLVLDIFLAARSRKGNGGLKVISKGNSTSLIIKYDSTNVYEKVFYTEDDAWFKSLLDLLDEKDTSKEIE